MYNENIDLDDETTSSGGFDFNSFYNNNKKLIWVLIGIIIFIIFVSMITSCGRTTPSDNNQENTNLEPALVLNNKSETVTIGSSKQIFASVTNYPNALITYSSSDENIATVSSSGLITGKNLGTVTINVVYVHNNAKVYREECLVTVSLGNDTIKLSSVTMPDGDLIMGINSRFELSNKIIISPNGAYIYQKHYESSNPNVVTVDENGVVKSLSEGTAYITLTVNNTFECKIKVIVLNQNINAEIVNGPESITIASGLIKLKLSEKKKIDYTVTPANANTLGIVFTSSNPNVVNVNNYGEITGLSEGSSTVTVTTPSGVSSKTIVEVSKYGDEVVVESVSYSQTQINLTQGSSYSIDPIIKPLDAVDKTLTFTSSNPTVVSVTPSNGISAIITANSVGTATIKFTSSNGKSGTVIVNVSGNNNYNNNNYNNGGSSNNGSSSSNDDNNSSSSSSNVKYATITSSVSNISILSSSYTTFKISANTKGTFYLSTSRSEISYPSSQKKTIKVDADEEVEVKVQGSKSVNFDVNGYVNIKFVPSDSSLKEANKIIKVVIK